MHPYKKLDKIKVIVDNESMYMCIHTSTCGHRWVCRPRTDTRALAVLNNNLSDNLQCKFITFSHKIFYIVPKLCKILFSNK